MTRRQEQRYRRLLKEGFPRWEARGFIDTKITQPAMRLLRKERRATLREYKKQGAEALKRVRLYRKGMYIGLGDTLPEELRLLRGGE